MTVKRSLSPWARIVVIVAVALLVLAAALFIVFWFAGRNITDIGPLDLPGVPPSPAEGEEVLLAVGDIGSCDGTADDEVARLAAELPGTIAMLGDNAYPTGTADAYRECLRPAWGALLPRVRAAVGNHDYDGSSADAYFGFFGSAGGPAGEGWYSYDLGDWHVVVLNSNCSLVGCGPGSAQMSWLADDLAAHGSDCLLAYWHHPRYSSGRHGSSSAVAPFWDSLVAAGVDVVLSGHDHSYERLEADGVESFVVGTGGRSLYRFERPELPQTAVRHDGSYGLLYLVLGDGTFRWEFLPLGVTTFGDSGSGDC